MTTNAQLRAILRKNSQAFIAAVAANFPALQDKGTVEEIGWDAMRFRSFGIAASHGERCAVQFVLSVWNSTTNWDDPEVLAGWVEEAGVTEAQLGWDPLQAKIGRFDLFDALGVWDDANRAAFIEWAKDPIWP